MQYISTRGQSPKARFSDILLAGLAPDGGLYLPEHYPQVTPEQLKAWRNLSYADLAHAILSLYIDDIPSEDLQAICHKTYSAEVFCNMDPTHLPYYPIDGTTADITPLTWLETNFYRSQAMPASGIALLGLSNGPTLAFKDIALQLVGNLFEYVLEKRGETLTILGATSGDTGPAAEYALRGKKGIQVFMLSPYNAGMSPFQAAQMYSLKDENIHNIAIHGMFDDAQDIVKAISSDASFKACYRIGAVNSINWARILAQVVYYFKAYLAATENEENSVNFAIPSGNFGNACAGHIARMMGLPIDKLIIGTNENDVLADFFATGIYQPRQKAEITSSPSMDITKASNFERVVFDMVGRNGSLTRELFENLSTTGEFHLSATVAEEVFGFLATSSTHQDRLEMIEHVCAENKVLIDPHTADAYFAANSLYDKVDGIIIILETAQACKFEQIIWESTGMDVVRPTSLVGIEDRPQKVEVIMPDLNIVKAMIEAVYRI